MMETKKQNYSEFHINSNIAKESYFSNYAFNWGLNTGGSLREYSEIYLEFGFGLENISKYIEQNPILKNSRESTIENYKQCFEIYSINYQGYYYRGDLKYFVKDYIGAIQEYTKAIEINPTYDFAYNSRGICKCFLNDYSSAIEDFNKALELDSKNDKAGFNKNKAKMKILQNTLNDATEEYENKNYKKALSQFEIYFHNSRFNSILSPVEDIATAYLFFQLKANDSNAKLNTGNTYYLYLDTLIQQYNVKKDRKEKTTEDEDNAHKLIEYHSCYLIGFGKYEGQKVEDIIQKDCQYILWCILNLYHFSISNILLIRVCSKT